MKTWAPQETQKTIYTMLSGDADLIALLGGPRVYDSVPDNAVFPYVTIELRPMQNRSNHNLDGVELTLQVNVWVQGTSRGAKAVQSIQKRIDDMINAVDLIITGWVVVSCRRTLVDVLTEADNVTKHGVQQFKILLGEDADA